MKALVFYYVEHLGFGPDDERTGWYLMRATLIDDRGTGLSKGSITDRTPLAKFGAGASLPRASGADIAFEARQLSDAVKSGSLIIVPQGWTIDMVMRAEADASLFERRKEQAP